MSVINISSSDKDIEFTNLEAHVTLCSLRHLALERKINEIQEQQNSYRVYFMRFFVALAVSAITGTAAILFHASGNM